MKKLLTIALSVLMLLSCFAFSVSADNGVNVAAADKGATYYYLDDMSTYWQGSCKDDSAELLNDGVVPEKETPFETVAVAGTGRVIMVKFDLGALYTDITAVNFLCVWDSYGDQTSGKNRGFSGEKTTFRFSADGNEFTRNKNFTMDRVKMDPETADSYYNYNFTFDDAITARYVELMFYSPDYICSLGEIEVISTSGEGVIPEEPSSEEEPSEEEPSEEEPSEEEPAVSTEESTASEEAPATSTEESEAASTEESKAEESKAEESKTEESKAETSKTETSTDVEEEGGSAVVIIIIVVAVVAVAAVVVILMKKKK